MRESESDRIAVTERHQAFLARQAKRSAWIEELERVADRLMVESGDQAAVVAYSYLKKQGWCTDPKTGQTALSEATFASMPREEQLTLLREAMATLQSLSSSVPEIKNTAEKEPRAANLKTIERLIERLRRRLSL